MKTKFHTPLSIGIAMLAMAGSVNAATIVLVNESFESGLGSWGTSGGTRHYIHNTTNQPTSNTHNYATVGTGAANLPGNNSFLTIPSSLALVTGGFTDITISFGDQFFNGSTTRRGIVQYSDDGGTIWTTLGTWDSGENGGNETIRNSSITLTEGSTTTFTGAWHSRATTFNPGTFTDTTLFQFAFNTNNSGHHLFIDNVVISGTSTIPEPSAALLVDLGFLALLRRRR